MCLGCVDAGLLPGQYSTLFSPTTESRPCTKTLKVKHSTRSFTASADGKVVQATDTGAANQLWAAAAN